MQSVPPKLPLAASLTLFLLAGCPTDSSAPTSAKPAPGQGAKPKKGDRQHASEQGAGQAQGQDENLGRIRDDAPLPLVEMLGHPPPEVQRHLGEHLGKGGQRDSCVRYVPEASGGPTLRTWFRCKHVWQRYADKTGTFASIGVEYEDGKCTAIAMEGIPGKGPFDRKQALERTGFDLPGDPKMREPAAGVKVWSYFNNAARLKIDDKEYRLEVSVVEDDWSRAKVEILLNHHLTDDERARVIQIGDRKVGSGSTSG
jgi:hypothetical protein